MGRGTAGGRLVVARVQRGVCLICLGYTCGRRGRPSTWLHWAPSCFFPLRSSSVIWVLFIGSKHPMSDCRWVTNRSNYPLWNTKLLIKFGSLFCQNLTWHIIDLPSRNNGKLPLIVFAKGLLKYEVNGCHVRSVYCTPCLIGLTRNVLFWVGGDLNEIKFNIFTMAHL